MLLIINMYIIFTRSKYLNLYSFYNLFSQVDEILSHCEQSFKHLFLLNTFIII